MFLGESPSSTLFIIMFSFSLAIHSGLDLVVVVQFKVYGVSLK